MTVTASPETIAAISRQRKTVERLLAVKKARGDVLRYAQLMTPDPHDPDDVALSRYEIGPLHAALGRAIQEIEAGLHKRLIINVPPRHGKTQLVSKLYPSWFIGRDPYRSTIVATYNDTFAEEFGRAVRGYMQSATYAQVFPETKLAKGSAASDRLITENGGQLSFVGVGGTITGRGGDLLIVDDPIKSTEEASSATIREKLWKWFNNDLMSRMMSDKGVVLLIQTRWHEDDIVGRITDPTNPNYNPEEAALWKIINIPALAEENDPLGRKIGDALWPDRFGRNYLLSAQRRDPIGFSALYQGRPTPGDGDKFKADDIVEYGLNDLPRELRYYMAVDLAVATKQNNDKSCVMVVGIDEDDNIWIVDVVWMRMTSIQATEVMLQRIKRFKPQAVFAEADHISKSIGPFLLKRMREEKAYAHIIELPGGTQDKVKKAQPIIARSGMKMIHYPKFAKWYPAAREELFKFPRGTHDDFVDTLANIGRGLDKLVAAPAQKEEKPSGPRVGTMAWVKAESVRQERATRQSINMAGM